MLLAMTAKTFYEIAAPAARNDKLKTRLPAMTTHGAAMTI